MMVYKSPKELILPRLHGKMKANGFISVNGPCCVHNGETQDKRGRGGFKFDATGSVGYNCFNCKFKTVWTPGTLLSKKMKNLLSWMSVDEGEISKLSFDLWRFKSSEVQNDSPTDFYFNPRFEEKTLPKDSINIKEFINGKKTPSEHAVKIIEYLYNRDPLLIDKYDWYHSDTEYKDYVIIPYYYENKIVGWTGRNTNSSGDRYIKDTVNDFIFNIEKQKDKNILLLVEGILDGINLDCASLLGSNISEKQKYWINSLNKKVVVFPDFDKSGKDLAMKALQNGWYVSVPPRVGNNQVWEKNIKDASEAVKKYGKLYTINAILSHASNNKDYVKTAITLNY
jgi:5S rRNA maturation endonuclease (ribonuclease M5)